MNDTRPKTVICDIDGTLIIHTNPCDAARNQHNTILLDGTEEKLREWDRKGYNIILLTGRKESLRKVTEKQLANAGIFYDQLIMGVGGGKRYLINDRKPNDTEDYAIAINIERDKGIKDLEI
jgi:ribonucleotide monophosphatase NagD (HAD superfamily)